LILPLPPPTHTHTHPPTHTHTHTQNIKILILQNVRPVAWQVRVSVSVKLLAPSSGQNTVISAQKTKLVSNPRTVCRNTVWLTDVKHRREC